jgi:PAS domain S-box-containing protein
VTSEHDLGTLFARMADRHPAYRDIVERDPSGELAIACFEMLFDQNVEAVFFMMLDEPMEWCNEARRDDMLDYAYDHLRITAVNDAFSAQMGAPREVLLGQVPRDRWFRDPELWRRNMSQLYTQGRIHHSLRAPHATDNWFHIEGEYVCTYDARGRITGHCGMQRDVTEKRRTALALAKSRERLELAIECADIGVWDVDVANRQILFEPGWMTRLGYGPERLWRDYAWWGSIIHPDDFPSVQTAYRNHIDGLVPLFQVEYRARTKAGDYTWTSSTGKVTTRSADGTALRVVGTCVDITERKRLDARLTASERLAALGTLAAGVGHEINNPLTYIALSLELVARELQTGAADLDKLRTIVDQARYGTHRVGAVVRDLQSLARSPDDRVAAIQLTEILPRCLQIADHQLRHRARVICDLGPTPAVACSEDRAVQLFLNLIVNAAQALPVGRADHYWIRITSRTANDGRAVVEISDNGVGIETEDLERIFDPFFTTKGAGEGTGLGLAICRNIIDMMEGSIDIDTTRDRGTTFRVSLPPARDLAIAAAAAPPPRLDPGTRILVIDDEAIIGRLICAALEGYDVVAETSARAAVARIHAGEHFDRILCDLMMPEVTGMDFYDLLPPQLRDRVVFLTGGAFTDRARRFLAQVPNRRLDKPFDVEDLEAVLAD